MGAMKLDTLSRKKSKSQKSHDRCDGIDFKPWFSIKFNKSLHS